MASIACVVIAAIQSPLHVGGDILFMIQVVSEVRVAFVILILFLLFLAHTFYLKKFFLSGSIHLDPLLDIVLILAAAKLLGIMGMFFIIPIYYIYEVVLQEFYAVLVKE